MASARTSERTIALALLLLSACSAAACAHLGAPGPVVADRPGFTDTPVALPARAVQLETGVTGDQTGPSGAITSTITAGELLLRLGVGARSELRLFGNSYDVRRAPGAPDARGWEDLKLGGKVNLRAAADSLHSWMPNVALLGAVTMPSGAGAISAGSAQAEAKLAVNWTTASPFSLYANVGYLGASSEFTERGKGWTSAAGWWALNPRVSLFGEAYVFSDVGDIPGTHGGATVDAGATYLVNDRLQVDVRAGHGLVGLGSDERFLGVGLARRW